MSNKVNYLAELYDLNEINAENVKIDEKYGYTIKNNKGEWRNYEDPDAKSKALYIRWLEFFNKKMPEGEFEIECNKSFAIRATINKKTFYLSSDYIGPSKYYAVQAFKANNRDEHKEMADIFNVCQCFEGHIIWPKGQIIDNNHVYIPYGSSGKNTINMSRGGDKGVFDRIDVTLYLLKKYYNLFIEKENSNTKIFDRARIFITACNDKIDEKNNFRLFNLFLSFELASEWLGVFNNFDAFIDIFFLQDFIKDGEPFISGDGSKIVDIYEKNKYINYIDKCKEAIERRGERLSS